MPAQLLRGAGLSARLRAEIESSIQSLIAAGGRAPQRSAAAGAHAAHALVLKPLQSPAMSFDWLADWTPSDDRDPLHIIDEAAEEAPR